MNLNMSNLTDRFMKSVDNVVFDMLTNKIGVLRDDSIFYAQKGEDGKYEMYENPIGDMSMSLPAFALATPMDQLNEGDLILDGKGKPVGWIITVNKKSLKVLKVTGTISTMSPAKVEVLGQGQTVMVVKNMMGTNDNGTQMNQMLPMMMMMGDGADSKDKMMQMMMMQGMMGQQGGNQMNQMLPMMMMMSDDKKGGKDKMMQMMLMQSMIGQQPNQDPNAQPMQMNPMLMAMMMSK